MDLLSPISSVVAASALALPFIQSTPAESPAPSFGANSYIETRTTYPSDGIYSQAAAPSLGVGQHVKTPAPGPASRIHRIPSSHVSMFPDMVHMPKTYAAAPFLVTRPDGVPVYEDVHGNELPIKVAPQRVVPVAPNPK